MTTGLGLEPVAASQGENEDCVRARGPHNWQRVRQRRPAPVGAVAGAAEVPLICADRQMGLGADARDFQFVPPSLRTPATRRESGPRDVHLTKEPHPC